jgi:5-methylcytosine-specific restriction endonuclease McrA
MVPKGHYYACNLDHILPVARGGANELENCQVLADKVNYAKGDMTNDEFLDMVTLITKGEMYKKHTKGKK